MDKELCVSDVDVKHVKEAWEKLHNDRLDRLYVAGLEWRLAQPDSWWCKQKNWRQLKSYVRIELEAWKHNLWVVPDLDGTGPTKKELEDCAHLVPSGLGTPISGDMLRQLRIETSNLLLESCTSDTFPPTIKKRLVLGECPTCKIVYPMSDKIWGAIKPRKYGCRRCKSKAQKKSDAERERRKIQITPNRYAIKVRCLDCNKDVISMPITVKRTNTGYNFNPRCEECGTDNCKILDPLIFYPV